MKTVKTTLLLPLLCSMACVVGAGELPFPNADQETANPEVRRLVQTQSRWREDLKASSEAKTKILAMGTGAVPSLIILLKQSANRDPRVLGHVGVQDFGHEIRTPLYDLRDIGGRRAIPVLSKLVQYDHPKPRRMLQVLAELLCHGSDEQIALDAKSADPNVARAAQMIIREPMTFAPCKKEFRKTKVEPAEPTVPSKSASTPTSEGP